MHWKPEGSFGPVLGDLAAGKLDAELLESILRTIAALP